MKATTSALLFASVAAASDYGYGYEAKPTSSSSSKVGYTTVYPGHGKAPVTVTSQYQPIPTYYADESDSKTGSWSEYPYVSTVIDDYDGKKTTITDVNEKVTVYHTKSTITKYTTEYGYAPAPTGYGGYSAKNATTTTKAHYELYEKVHEVKYKELGPKALPGYKGSGLWKDEKKQPVEVKEYKDGKWETKYEVFTYGEPKPSTTKFEKPGVYTLPASDITVNKPYTAPAEAHYTAPAGKPVTYGGITATVTKSTTITAAYPTEETHGAETKTVIKYKTITCPHAGKYEVAKPTTTSYDHDTTVTYPTVTVYVPGVYHHPKETVTVTKSNEDYTCSYSQTKTYPTYPTTTGSYPVSVTKDAYPTSTPADTYPTTSDEDSYPTSTYDPSASYPEPTESYGTPYAGYVKRGGMLERRSPAAAPKKAQAGKRVILV